MAQTGLEAIRKQPKKKSSMSLQGCIDENEETIIEEVFALDLQINVISTRLRQGVLSIHRKVVPSCKNIPFPNIPWHCPEVEIPSCFEPVTWHVYITSSGKVIA